MKSETASGRSVGSVMSTGCRPRVTPILEESFIFTADLLGSFLVFDELTTNTSLEILSQEI